MVKLLPPAAEQAHGEIGDLSSDEETQAGSATTELINATQAGDAAAVDEALKKGADVNSVDHNDWPLIGAAAFRGCTRIVELLADAGNDVDRSNPNNATAVLLAAQNGEVATVQLLLERYSADIDAQKRTGVTALWVAAQNGHHSTLQESAVFC